MTMYATIIDRDERGDWFTFEAELYDIHDIHDIHDEGEIHQQAWIAGDGLRLLLVYPGFDDYWMVSGELLPYVHVQLTGQDGNAFAILGTVRRALEAAGLPALARFYMAEATRAGDYDQLLRTTMRYVTVC